MNVSDAVRQRHSVRAFKPEQPPAAMVRSILEQAARAPSGGNLQPWHVHALAGEPLAAQTLQAYLDVFTHHYLQAKHQLPPERGGEAHQRLQAALAGAVAY